ANRTMIIVTDGIQNQNVLCYDAVNYLPDNLGTVANALAYGTRIKNEGIYITLAILGDTQNQIDVVASQYGGSFLPAYIPNYPLPSVGNGLYGHATYVANFSNALEITSDIVSTVCRSVVPIDCGSCNFNETVNLCECEESVEPTYIDKVSPVELTNTNYFKDVSWTVAFKFEEKGFNSYHSFHPNFYNPHQDFFQTGFNAISS